LEKNDIFNDLDIRASDLLQANCIIWVEGPSDRLYINKWIQLWSNNEVKEGNNFQFIIYGGDLRSHLQAKDCVINENDLINILNVNRNIIMCIDSDRNPGRIDLNDTKKRLQLEIEKNGGIAWITKGREIENYISPSVFDKLENHQIKPKLKRYEKIENYLSKNSIKMGTKVSFAKQVCQLTEIEDISNHLDLSDKLTLICNKIKEWNNINT